MIKPLKLLLLGTAFLISCQNAGKSSGSTHKVQEEKTRYAGAIQAILKQDGELGAIRNHACEDTSLSFTVRQYIDGLDALDFNGCPTDFTTAFRKHRDAWQASIPFFKPFDDLRGEMHDLFEQIKQSGVEQKKELDQLMKPVADTWVAVENTADKYGTAE